MGIPNLTRSLLPYSTPIHISPDPPSDTETEIKTLPALVIDGPGLIYHIYNRLLSLKPPSLNAIDAQPSGWEVSCGVVRFLAAVVGRGVVVKKIYFDGALPVEKRGVRAERMEASRRKMEGFCWGYAGGFKTVSMATCTTMSGDVGVLFGGNGTKTPEKFKGLPENPVMIPCAIEDLLTYWTWGRVRRLVDCGVHLEGEDEDLAFADMVQMVPNEADIYCAEVARLSATPVGVLTSDSDLLVHDLGEWGSVVFYDSLEMSSDDEVIKGMEILPASIAKRLGVVSIPRLAFEMKVDRGVSLSEAVRRAKDSSGRVEGSARFRGFMEEYEPLKPVGERTREGLYSTKLAELVAQFDYPRLRGKEGGYHMYLPILIEDHTRRSAWGDGMDIRVLAYSLLNLFSSSESQTTSILEFSRRGSRIAPTPISLPQSLPDLTSHLSTLLTNLHTTQSLLDRRSQPLKFWTLFALKQSLESDPRNIPSEKELINFLTQGSMDPTKLYWTDVHLSARMMAVLFSVKGLGEVLDAIGGGVFDGDEWEEVREVREWVGSLPRGSELFGDRGERGRWFRGVETGGLVSGLVGGLQIERDDGADGDADGWVDGKGKKRGRRKSKVDGEEKVLKKGKGGGNMFDLLAGME